MQEHRESVKLNLSDFRRENMIECEWFVFAYNQLISTRHNPDTDAFTAKLLLLQQRPNLTTQKLNLHA